jgi:inositol-1,3,4-trisphosphate 5/6-kinase/inositol-tetrakisphosphate 1-kinase
MDEKRCQGMGKKSRRVGYWLTDKKIRRLNFDAFEALCRSSGIDMVKLNLDQPLDQQGPFHLILHKITDQLARTQDGSQTVMKQIEAVQAYLSEHPEIKVIDPVENVMRLLDRHQQYQIVKECQVVDEQCHYYIPAFVELTTSDVADNVRLIAENSIEFPIDGDNIQ